ncbi:hypothetical protein, partial [Klebsiella pneumoniae]
HKNTMFPKKNYRDLKTLHLLYRDLKTTSTKTGAFEATLPLFFVEKCHNRTGFKNHVHGI